MAFFRESDIFFKSRKHHYPELSCLLLRVGNSNFKFRILSLKYLLWIFDKHITLFENRLPLTKSISGPIHGQKNSSRVKVTVYARTSNGICFLKPGCIGLSYQNVFEVACIGIQSTARPQEYSAMHWV